MDNFIFTRPHQMCASNLGEPNKSTLMLNGFGYLPLHTQHFPRTEIETLFIPTPDEIVQTPTQKIFDGSVCELSYFQPADEFGHLGTQKNLESFFRQKGFFLANSSSLLAMGISNGAVTKGSQCDFVFVKDGFVLGVVEMKGAEASLLLGLRQAIGYSSNMVMLLLDFGVPYAEIYVPCISCNGISIQFGVTMVLAPSFPSFVPISPPLDLVHHEQTVIAYMNKACVYMDAVYQRVKDKGNVIAKKREMLLDKTQYFLKPLSKEVLRRGLGKFNVGLCNELCFDAGLYHMFRGLGRLYRSPRARQYVVFPLAVRTPNTTECIQFESSPSGGGSSASSGKHAGIHNYIVAPIFTPAQIENIKHTQKLGDFALVYKDITHDGFRMGTPDRNTQKTLFDKFILALLRAVKSIHEAGVVHGDLYPSNIFWKTEEGEGGDVEISIKMIDWDICHCLNEGSFRPAVQIALNEHEGGRVAFLKPYHDLRYIEALNTPANNESEREQWTAIATGDRVEMNLAFRAIFQLYQNQFNVHQKESNT